MSIEPTTQADLAADFTVYAIDQICGGKSSLSAVVAQLIQMGMSHGYNEAQAGKTSVEFHGFKATNQEDLTQWSRVHMMEAVAQGKRTLYQAVWDIIAKAANYRMETRLAEIAEQKVPA